MDKTFLGLLMVWFFGMLLSFSMEGVQGVVTTTLSADVGQTATTFNVASTSGFAGSSTLVVGDELITYTGKTGTTFTGMTRGVENTAASSYDSGDIVFSEGAGLVNNLMDFSTLDFSGNIFQSVGTLFSAGAQTFVFMARILIWDFSYFDGSVLSVPLVYLQYFFYLISAAVVWKLIQLLRGVG